MKILSKIATVFTLSTILIQGNCYAGKPVNCFSSKTYKDKDYLEGKIFAKKYLSQSLEFMRSPFFINQVAYIPFSELHKIVDLPNVKNYFYSATYKHSKSIKTNPLALIKFIVESQKIYNQVVCDYLESNSHLLQIDFKKRLYTIYIALEKSLEIPRNLTSRQFLLIPPPSAYINPQHHVEVSEGKDNQVPVSSTVELNTESNGTTKREPIPSIFDLIENSGLIVESNETYKIPHLIEVSPT